MESPPELTLLSRSARSINGDRIAGRSRASDYFQRRPDKRELVNLGIDQRFQIHVFEVPDAAPGLHLRVAMYSIVSAELAGRLRIVRRGVAAHQGDIAGSHVLACTDAKARFTGTKFLPRLGMLRRIHLLVYAVAPDVAVSGM